MATAAERMARKRERDRKGLVPVTVDVPNEDADKIRQLAAKLVLARIAQEVEE